MKNTIRRLLPLILVLALSVCLCCVSALAVDTGADDEALPIEILEPQIPTTNDEIIEIPDEAVPVAEAPVNAEQPATADAARQVTGDSSAIWLVLVGVSCAVLVTLVAAESKRSKN